jgi:hypothetical protein
MFERLQKKWPQPRAAWLEPVEDVRRCIVLNMQCVSAHFDSSALVSGTLLGHESANERVYVGEPTKTVMNPNGA